MESASNKRILFVVNDPAFFVSHRLPIAIGAREVGFEVSVASPCGPAVATIELAGIRHVPWPLQRASTNPLGELRALIGLAAIIRSEKPEILHLITMKPVLYGGLLRRLIPVPLSVFAVSGLGYSFIASGAMARLRRKGLVAGLRLALRQAGCKVIFQNPDDRDLFIQSKIVARHQAHLIKGSGTDLDKFAPQPEPVGTLVVLLPARMLWDKGVGEFVAAARLVLKQMPNTRFVLSGKVDEQNPAAVPLEQLEAWNSEGVVQWLPHTEDIATRLAQCHVVVLPSYREGLPKSLVDAAASGRAIVTTDTPGCRHVIESGVSGLLVPPRNVEHLAVAILSLLSDAKLRQALGRAGRALAESEYSIDAIVKQHLHLYASGGSN